MFAGNDPHRRWNPLREEWVLVSPHRSLRPWQGAVEGAPISQQAKYDPSCYLCPGNLRASGDVNPDYTDTYVFQNDFPALLPLPNATHVQTHSTQSGAPEFIRQKQERGECRVVCFSPEHNQTMSALSTHQIELVIKTWQEQTTDLASHPWVSNIMIFENKGAIMGCSNPHPHGQIWATESIPGLPERELHSQSAYFAKNGQQLLLHYAEWEESQDIRIVVANKSWLAVVPFWATWPFETLVLPKRAVQYIHQLTNEEVHDWARLLKGLLTSYDRLFACSFPYSMGVYQAPVNGSSYEGFQLNQKFFPPLLRSADVKKHMVGYELCAEAQRDLTPESAAAKLRAAV